MSGLVFDEFRNGDWPGRIRDALVILWCACGQEDDQVAEEDGARREDDVVAWGDTGSGGGVEWRRRTR